MPILGQTVSSIPMPELARARRKASRAPQRACEAPPPHRTPSRTYFQTSRGPAPKVLLQALGGRG
eukprot:14017832-Alexandrium_andersonii.AAC.1